MWGDTTQNALVLLAQQSRLMADTFSEEFPIRSPGFRFPWMAVVQDDEDGGFAWGLYSQGGRAAGPVASGSETNVEAARTAATEAAKARR